ncbi:MAG: type II secretion system protein GspG [Chthoniobacterales bacterium]
MKPSPANSIKQPGAFSLIELLVVIAIIAVLAGLILQTAGYVQNKAARSRAETEIAALSAALESYKADYGDYPAGTGGVTNSTVILFDSLVAAASSNNPLGKVYMEANGGMLKNTNNLSSPGNAFLDPFGAEYIYKYPGDADRSGTNFFDLYSKGGDTTATNTNKWIKNW